MPNNVQGYDGLALDSSCDCIALEAPRYLKASMTLPSWRHAHAQGFKVITRIYKKLLVSVRFTEHPPTLLKNRGYRMYWLMCYQTVPVPAKEIMNASDPPDKFPVYKCHQRCD